MRGDHNKRKYLTSLKVPKEVGRYRERSAPKVLEGKRGNTPKNRKPISKKE